jgi:hypothetical protein
MPLSPWRKRRQSGTSRAGYGLSAFPPSVLHFCEPGELIRLPATLCGTQKKGKPAQFLGVWPPDPRGPLGTEIDVDDATRVKPRDGLP